MGSMFHCEYYELPGGREPVRDFIEGLDRDTQDTFFFKLGLLEEFGNQLRHPHTANIGEGIFELRFKGKEGQVRILFFFFYKNRIIFTNGFVKKVQKTPANEIALAEKRRRVFLESEGTNGKR